MKGNCVLSYVKGGTVQSFTCWSNAYAYGNQLVSEESQSRRERTLYPHRVVPAQFSVTLLLKANTAHDANDKPIPGTSQYDRWGAWMAAYYNYMLEVGNSSATAGNRYSAMMSVTMKGRNWTRYGIPVSGVTYGDHLGSILYTPTVVFETAVNPYDAQTNLPAYSKWNDYQALSADPDHAKWFYPFSGYSMGDKDEDRFDLQQLLDYRGSAVSTPSSLSNGESILPTQPMGLFSPSPSEPSQTDPQTTATGDF